MKEGRRLLKPLMSKEISVDDPIAAIELFMESGWTDGLPIVPPTPELVRRMVGDYDPQEFIGYIPPKYGGATLEKLAINAAVQVDLTGQVNSESLGTRQMSGTGGLVDFVRGAARSRGGRSIIALPSTALGGKVSRIVPVFEPGTAVSVLRAEAHWLVTEYGARDLRGMTLRERANALIEIAHPDFREELTDAARERHLLV